MPNWISALKRALPQLTPIPPQIRLARRQEIQELMVRFQAAEPNDSVVQELEVLVRTPVFKSANQLVAYLLQQAADRIDAAYQPKPGRQHKARVPLTLLMAQVGRLGLGGTRFSPQQ